MDTLAKLIGGIILLMVGVFFVSTIGGTILWLIYPHIHALFPTAAQNGIIAQKLDWWDSVCVVWIFGILIKGSNSSSSSSK